MVEASNKLMVSKTVKTLYTSKYFENMETNIRVSSSLLLLLFLNKYVK